MNAIPPRYPCDQCEGWRTIVNPDGPGTMPCPDCTPAPAPAPKPAGGTK